MPGQKPGNFLSPTGHSEAAANASWNGRIPRFSRYPFRIRGAPEARVISRRTYVLGENQDEKLPANSREKVPI
jgi:hypothetical protein